MLKRKKLFTKAIAYDKIGVRIFYSFTKEHVMKQYLLPNEGTFYKANLHCHSTCSDGHLTPEELKEVYKAKGYSVLAYGDHNVLVDHSDLDEDGFLTFTLTTPLPSEVFLVLNPLLTLWRNSRLVNVR